MAGWFTLVTCTSLEREPGARRASATPSWGFRVRVVDDTTGAPIPHAEVGYADESLLWTAERRWRAAFTAGEVDDVVWREGSLFVCDEAGETRVPWWPGQLGCVVVRRGADRGRTALGPHEPTEPTLAMREPAIVAVGTVENDDLRVRVRDADGRPVGGVPIGMWMSPWYGRHLLARALTDDAGVATFPTIGSRAHVEFATGEVLLPDDRWPDGPLPFVVGIEQCRRTFDEKEIDPSRVPRDPVDLVLPATGTVVVALVDPSGRPVMNRSVHVALFAERQIARQRSRPSDPSPAHAIPPGARYAQTDETGRARFDYVPLDLVLAAQAWTDELPERISAAAVDGPTTVGQETVVLVPFTPDFPRVSGVACDGDGDPLAGRRLLIQGAADRDSYGERLAAVTTDEHGAWTFLLGSLPGPMRFLHFTIEDPFRPLAATVEWSQARTDLGSVSLSPFPALFRGRTLDATGRPVAGARVWLEWYDELRGDWNGWSSGTISDSRGRFVITGTWPDDDQRFRAVARGGGYAVSRTEPLTRDGLEPLTDITMRTRTTSLTVRFRSLPGIAPRNLLATLRPGGSFDAPIYPDGSPDRWIARWEDLEPGRADAEPATCSVTLLRGSSRVVTTPAISLVPGPNVFPRFGLLDLRDHARTVSITIVDQRGRPVRDADVWIGPESADVDAPASWFGCGDDDGVYRVAFPPRPMRAAIEAPRTRRIELETLNADTRVVLPDALHARLVLRGPVTIPRDARIQVQLRLTSHFSEFAVFDADRRVDVWLREPGTWSAEFGLTRPTRSDSFVALTDIDRRLEVADVARVQEFAVDLDQAVIDTAVKRWSSDR